MAVESFTAQWAEAQKPRAASLTDVPVFYQNMEESLDRTRAQGNCMPLHTQELPNDFSSCDSLSLGSSGLVKQRFLEELNQYPDFQLGSHSTRLLDGNSKYLEALEADIAKFSKVESALIVQSGGMANNSIFATIPRPGDVIVYDELSHTTTLGGIRASLALEHRSFLHNDVDSFIEVLEDIRDSPEFQNGKSTVIVAVESFYSMDGDICPLRELVDAAKEVFPDGRAQFVIDEAHSFGNIGPGGGGLVAELQLEKEIAVRMHIFGKALASSGAVILSNNTIRRTLLNRDRVIMTTTAPSFPVLAAMRASLELCRSEVGELARKKLQHITKFFLDTLMATTTYKKVCPVWTREKYAFYLSFHLLADGIGAFGIVFPIVPKGKDRVRLVMHANHTEDQIRVLVNSLCSWAEEMLEIEQSGDVRRLPKAAQDAYDMIEKAN